MDLWLTKSPSLCIPVPKNPKGLYVVAGNETKCPAVKIVHRIPTGSVVETS